jgi:hypothetical protein
MQVALLCFVCLQVILAADEASAARWGALDDVVMVSMEQLGMGCTTKSVTSCGYMLYMSAPQVYAGVVLVGIQLPMCLTHQDRDNSYFACV